jgi:hypothetical protein
MSNWLDEWSFEIGGWGPTGTSFATISTKHKGWRPLHHREDWARGFEPTYLDRARFFRGHGLTTVNPGSRIEREPIKIGKMRDVLKNSASQARFGRDVIPL